MDVHTSKRGRNGFFGVLLLFFVWSTALGVEPLHVLLLHSFERGFEPFQTFSSYFRTELAQQLDRPVVFHDVALESARYEAGAGEDELLNYLNVLFAGRRLDLVVPIGGPAAQFAQNHRQQLFPLTPMLLASVDQRLVQSYALATNETSVAVSNEPARALENVFALLPQTLNVAVVIGNSPLEKFWRAELDRQFQAFTNRVNFVWFNDLTFAEMRRRAAALPPKSAIFYAVLSIDAEGVPYQEEQALNLLHEVANAPIFGLHDSQLGRGIVGGPLMAINELSLTAVKVAVRILRGEPAGNIKTPTQFPGRSVYDWRELQRWAISEARLPKGSMIEFRQPTFWSFYKWRIISVSSLCLLEAFLITLLLVNLAKKRRVEKSLRESEERLNLATAAGDLGVWMLDISRNQVWASANWRQMFGFPSDEVIGLETVIQRIHRDDRPAVVRAMRHAVEARADYVAEYRLLRPDGTQRWIAARGRPDSTSGARGMRMLGASVDITERRQAEQSARDLSGRLISAQEEERARLAKELHDGLSQNLALLAVDLELCGQNPSPAIDQVGKRLKEFSQRTRELSNEVHRLSHDLHPAKLEQLGLASALGGFCREVGAGGTISVQFVTREVPRVLPADLALCLYRIAQEALFNAVKHSGASKVLVELVRVNAEVHLRVADDGRGFDPEAVTQTEHLGLISMRERARLVNGQITLESKLGEGTRVCVHVQLPEAMIA